MKQMNVFLLLLLESGFSGRRRIYSKPETSLLSTRWALASTVGGEAVLKAAASYL
jgi:hypothetical protein